MTSNSKTKPFPWRCPSCLEKTVNRAVVAYTAKIKHDGRTYEVPVPELSIPRCDKCDELLFGNDADEQITNALREHLGLMKPDQIRSQRERLGLTQKRLASGLGVASETISRWESGAVIQSRASDRLLRVFFEFPEVRAVLIEDGSLAHIGTGTRVLFDSQHEVPDIILRHVIEAYQENLWESYRLWQPNARRTLEEHLPQVCSLLTATTEFSTWLEPLQIQNYLTRLRHFHSHLVSGAKQPRWLVVSLDKSGPSSDRLADRLSAVAEELTEAFQSEK